MPSDMEKLSEDEFALLTDRQLFETKQRVLKKVMSLLGECEQQIHISLEVLPASVQVSLKSVSAKISRGENYKGSPWQVLDFPRIFAEEGIFALRTLCWWGKGFSITLHLSGKQALAYVPLIIDQQPKLAEMGFRAYFGNDPWQHDFEDSGVRPLEINDNGGTELLSQLEANGFVKILKVIPFEEWETLAEQVRQNSKTLFGILAEKKIV